MQSCVPKQKLVNSTMLVHFDPNAPLELFCDAPRHGIRAYLNQVMPNNEGRPIACMSRTLSKPETNYSQIDKEALSIVEGVRKLLQYLYGRHFTLWTGHKPLVSIFHPKKETPDSAAARMQRWAIILFGCD